MCNEDRNNLRLFSPELLSTLDKENISVIHGKEYSVEGKEISHKERILSESLPPPPFYHEQSCVRKEEEEPPINLGFPRKKR